MSKDKEIIDHLISEIWLNSNNFLEEIKHITEDGFIPNLHPDIQVFNIKNFNGFFGFNYWYNNILVAQVHIGASYQNNFIIYKRTYDLNSIKEEYFVYNNTGNFIYKSATLNESLIHFDYVQMDSKSPLIDFFYNYLINQYDKASEGKANTTAVKLIKEQVNNYYKNNYSDASLVLNDNTILNKLNALTELESESELKYSEKQIVYENHLEELKLNLKTKKRIHNHKFFKYDFQILLKRIFLFFIRLKKNPYNNAKGILYKYTFGIFIWFLSTVKNNLGYSIALAIYGPFTFYFITQPMNPHAMWAVGKVRNTFIQISESLTPKESEIKSIVVNPISQTKDKVKTDEVNLIDAGVQKKNETNINLNANQQEIKKIKSNKENNLKTFLPDSLKNHWFDRMDQFKAVQIKLEESMIHAVRMGRIEQIETQFNFPMIAESLFNDMLFYENYTLNEFKTSYPKLYNSEINFLNTTKSYLFYKLVQFVSDHPFIMMDLMNEQSEKDIYSARIFSIIKNLKKHLDATNIPYKLPDYYIKIKQLADSFEESKIHKNNIVLNLKQNSKLFKQDNIFNSDIFRSYMARNWETLFLQQNKKQEAASFGLQAYVWSIRNTLWCLGQIVSTKEKLFKNLKNKNVELIQSQYDYLESITHLITYEFTSIHKEFEILKNDPDNKLRKDMVEQLLKNLAVFQTQVTNMIRKEI